MTKTAITADTAKTVTVASPFLILKDKQQEGKVLSRTAKTDKPVMKATPLKTQPPFSNILSSVGTQILQGTVKVATTAEDVVFWRTQP